MSRIAVKISVVLNAKKGLERLRRDYWRDHVAMLGWRVDV